MSRKARRYIWFHLFHVDQDFYLESLDKSERKYWSIYLQICWINIRWRNRIYAQRNLPIYFYVHGEKNSLDQKIYFPVSHQGDFMKKKTKKTQLFISEDNCFFNKETWKTILFPSLFCTVGVARFSERLWHLASCILIEKSTLTQN